MALMEPDQMHAKNHFPESASFELKWLLCKAEAVASSEMKYRQFVFHLKKNSDRH